MAESERTLLEHYNLTTLFPIEWPKDKDESDASDDEQINAPKSKPLRRYTILERGSGKNDVKKASRKVGDGVANTVQKDESDPLGGARSVVQILRQRGLPVEEDLKLRNQFLLSSTSFSPTLFLSEAHNNATTESLLQGLDFLSKSIEMKSASLKVLVESNFERFVRAKATIDNVYNEMRNHGLEQTTEKKSNTRQSRSQGNFRNLTPLTPKQEVTEKRKNALTRESEYGVQGIKTPLVDAAVKAEEVWGPALGGREREENLKSVLNSIDNNRGIFEVGAAIQDCIKRRDYEALIREYAKAQRYSNETKQIADRAKQNEIRLPDSKVYQIVITARMWMDIQGRIAEFRRDTWRRLTGTHLDKPSQPEEKAEEYMELIAVLMQIGVPESPISAWLTSQHDFLHSKLTATFDRARVEIEILRRKLATGTKPSSKLLAFHLRSAANTGRNGLSQDMDSPQILQFWEKVQTSLRSILAMQGGILGELIEYWEIAQAFIQGKKQRSLPIGIDGKSRHHHQLDKDEVRELQKQVLDLFVFLRDQVHSLFVEPPPDDVSALFTPLPVDTPLSPISGRQFGRKFTFSAEDVPPLSPQTGEAWEKMAFWPPYSNSLSASTFLSKITNMVGAAAAEIASLELVKQDARLKQVLRSLVGDVRERSITAICAAWVSDSDNCRDLEDWTRSNDKKDLTNMPAYFSTFESSLLTNLQKIVYVSEASSGPGASEVISAPPARHIEAVQKSFRNSLYKAFSCFLKHVEKSGISNGVAADDDGLTIPAVANTRSNFGGSAMDASNINVRRLLTMSNFQAIRNETIPSLVNQFENNFLQTITDDSKGARDALAQLNAIVFGSYVRPTVDILKSLIAAGISSPTYAPDSTRPDDARLYVYEVLLQLVLVHTEVSRVAPAMTNQILSYLLEQLSLNLIDAFKKRPRYNLPALMQATLDVEFLAQTLTNYTTEKASEVQSQIYLALDERTDNDARQRLQNELPEMRAILKRLREKTKGQFSCFKRQRSSKRETN